MDPARPTLIRAIGRWALAAVVVNSVIGSGVFGLPGPLAGLAGPWSPVAVLVAGATIFTIVLCFAEVGSRFDQAGGPYLYTREAFGPMLGFQIGWLHIWTRILSAAAVLNVFISYLSALVPRTGSGAGRTLAMTVAMAVVTVVNVRGVRQTAWTVNAFTLAKLVPLGAVALIGLVAFDGTVLASQAVERVRWTDAVLLLVFAYGGFESAVIAGSETRDPGRDTAFALIAGMFAITAVYTLVQLAVVGVLPNAAASSAPVAAVLERYMGPAGLTLGSLAVLVSTYGWLTGFALMTPRILYSMGDRGELPGWLAHVHPRFRTPDRAIVLNSAIALALALAGSFGQLATFSAISRLGILATTCAALVALRRKWGMPDGFRAPGGPLLAVVGIGFCLWMLTTRSLEEAWFLPVVVGLGVLAALLARGQILFFAGSSSNVDRIPPSRSRSVTTRQPDDEGDRRS